MDNNAQAQEIARKQAEREEHADSFQTARGSRPIQESPDKAEQMRESARSEYVSMAGSRTEYNSMFSARGTTGLMGSGVIGENEIQSRRTTMGTAYQSLDGGPLLDKQDHRPSRFKTEGDQLIPEEEFLSPRESLNIHNAD